MKRCEAHRWYAGICRDCKVKDYDVYWNNGWNAALEELTKFFSTPKKQKVVGIRFLNAIIKDMKKEKL